MKALEDRKVLFVSSNSDIASVMNVLGQTYLFAQCRLLDSDDIVAEVLEAARACDAKIVVVDNRWMRHPIVSHGNFLLAEILKKEDINMFVVLQEKREQERTGETVIWHLNKKVRFECVTRSVDCLVRVGSFRTQPYDRDTGKPCTYSGGDSGMEDLARALRRGQAFEQCDWLEVFKAIKLSCESVSLA